MFPKVTIQPTKTNKFKYSFSVSDKYLNEEEIFNNLKQAYMRAKYQDIASGLNWYNLANKQLKFISEKYGISLDKVSTVCAVLSPLTRWDINIDITDKAINQFLNGKRIRVHFFKKNDIKAQQILSCNDEEFIIENYMNPKTGRKTYNFTYNILYPFHPKYITVDSFMISLAMGLSEYSFSPKINNNGYDLISRQIKHLSESFDMIPCQLQAILWNVSHRDNEYSYLDLINFIRKHDSDLVINKGK